MKWYLFSDLKSIPINKYDLQFDSNGLHLILGVSCAQLISSTFFVILQNMCSNFSMHVCITKGLHRAIFCRYDKMHFNCTTGIQKYNQVIFNEPISYEYTATNLHGIGSNIIYISDIILNGPF